MTDQQLVDFWSWILGIGVPVAIGTFVKIWQRQNKDKEAIKLQTADIKEVKRDVGTVKGGIDDQFEEISVALKRQLEKEIDLLNTRISALDTALTQEKTKNEQLIKQMNADREMYQKQLEEKERQLQAQINITNQLNKQMEDERKTFTEMGTRYTQLEDRFGDMEKQMIEQSAIIRTYDRILARADLARATPVELQNRQTLEIPTIGDVE